MVKRRRLIKVAALLIAVLVLLVTIALLYLNFADLSGWRDTLATVASDAIGRDLKINGEFRPEIGFTTRIVASDITLANPAWSDDLHMVSVDHLAGEIDLLSIFFGALTIGDVQITGARVLFEVDPEGDFNWALGSGEEPGGDGGEFEMVIGHALLDDTELVYRSAQDPPLQATVSHLEFTDDGTGMLDLDLEGSLEGAPLEISGRLGTFTGLINANAVKHDLTGRFADAEFSLSGAIKDLGSLTGVDSEISAKASELWLITDSIGLDPVIEGPFAIEASVKPSTSGSEFDLLAAAGGMSARATGTVDSLTHPESLDVTIDVSGPDVGVIASLAGIGTIPRQGFSVSGRLAWQGFPITFDELRVRVGSNTLDAHGVLGRPPLMDGTDFRVSGAGPDASALAALAGVALPAKAYSVAGRIVRIDGGVRIEEVEAELGRSTLSAHGVVGDPPGYSGTALDLQARIEHPDHFSSVVGRTLPDTPLDLTGRFAEGDGAIVLDGVTVNLGGHRADIDGRLQTGRGMAGSDLELVASGPDFSKPAGFAGLEHAPSVDYEVRGGLRVLTNGFELRGVSARVGDVTAQAEGSVSRRHDQRGTSLEISGSGPDLDRLAWLTKLDSAPAGDFEGRGAIEVTERGYRLTGAAVRVGGLKASVDGTITTAPGLRGTDLVVTASAPDLERAGRAAAPFVDLPPLPAEALTLATRISIDENGYRIDGLEGRLGRAEFSADGRIGTAPDFVGTDLAVESDGPDASLLKAVTGLEIPVAPFQVNGRFERLEDSYRFHRVRVRVGEHRASVDGSLGELPEMIGTDLEIHASGPDTNLYEALAGLPDLPDKPFTLDGRFLGTPDVFSTPEFRLTFGDSHLEGEFKADITGKPAVEARLNSRVLDLRRLRDQVETAKDATHPTPTEASQARKAQGALVFRDEPLNLAWLQAADADVAIRIDQLYLPAMRFRDLAVDVHLEDGRLEIERAAAAGRGEGRMTGSLLLEPRHETYRLETDVSFRHIRLDPPDAVTDLLQRPPIDVDIDFEAIGSTPHELANSTNGAVQLVIGTGIFDSSMLDLVTADILLTLLNAFNPFAKEDPTTEMQCGVALLSISDGIAKLEPMAFQSDKMTLLGEGKINLETEKLNLRWVTKPRKGIGVSASMITNPYIKLGGTLADPSLELKPLEAMTSTGVAVATMGISLVAKGMFDRITAEKKVCERALEEIASRTNDSAK